MSNETPTSNFRAYAIAFTGFAAGMFVTLLAINAGAPTATANPAVMVGTMVASGEIDMGKAITAFEIEGAVQGRVAFAEHKGVVSAEFKIDSAQPVEVHVTLPDGSVAITGFAQAPGKPLPPATVQDGELSLTSEGARHFALFLEKSVPEARSVTLRFVQGGQLIREETVELPPQT